MRHLLARLAIDRHGVTAIEYGLIAAVVAVALVAASPSIGESILGHGKGADSVTASHG